MICDTCGSSKFTTPSETPPGKRRFLDISKVAKLVALASDGEPFTVVCEKKNGDIRVMDCAIDPDKALSVPGTVAPDGQVKVWDRKANAPRQFSLDKVLRVSIP